MRLRWALIALIVSGLACTHTNKSKEAEEAQEGNETKISLNDVPPKVRDALVREAGGANIGTIDRDEQNGNTIYETDVTSGGQKWEIKVDANGNVISKKHEKD